MFGVTRMSTLVLLAVALACCGAGAARAALAPGIDVSHWQGTIDWLGVAGGGQRFVFAKATEGVTAVDATYPFNRSGAAGTGLRVGAYHFARPAGSDDAAIVASAVAQADHFVDFAQPATGDLPPVLDLESSGGLSATDLAAWTQAWLDDVEARVGVKALIYTSPNFWQTKVANSSAFALAGYPLWVAHWTKNSSPLVPAGNWGGRGWTFWQWSDCLSIAAISSKCTDGDRFNGPTAAAVAIPPVSGGAPVATAAPQVVGTPQTGKLLAATAGHWNGARPIQFGYQWQRCDAAGSACIAIAGAAKATYTPVAADAGHALAVSLAARGAAGSATASSRATVPVATSGGTTATAPVATTLPSVSGLPQVGQTLTALAGAWSGSPTAFAYQWRRCDATGAACESVAGASAAQYTVTPADLGLTLSLVVTATGRGGSRSAAAVKTAIVAAAPVAATSIGSGVVQQGVAGAVATTDAAATVTWQPGALAAGTTVAVTPTTAKLPLAGTVVRLELSAPVLYPLDVAYAAAPADAVVGVLPGAGVWQPVAELKSAALPEGQSAGAYRDAAGVLHVLTRAAGQVALFTAGAWGDPRRVPTVAPTLQQLTPGPVRATLRADGSLQVITRLYASSQANLTATVLGRGTIVQTGSRLGTWLHGAPARTVASQLLAPGTFPIRLQLTAKGAVRLKVTAVDPYGRRASVVLTLRRT